MTEVIKENYISRTTGDSPGTGPGVWSPGQAKTRAAGPWCFFSSATCNATCERLLVVEPKKLLNAFLLVETGKTWNTDF